ncbi:MAG: DUF1353 domain-containing protein [Actinobacteria bacterium]|nr:DUF1353 domain-containing protein [Actinomycetota bacterium]
MHGWTWKMRTSPFSALEARDQPARFLVEQIDDADFGIPPEGGFRYDGVDGEVVEVTAATLPSTDFASIPPFMSWFVSRYGRHTPAALVHDVLVVEGMPFADRVAADRTFLRMLDALDVPPVRSRLMWSAVSLATRWRGPLRARVGVVCWGLSAAAGLVLLGYGIREGRPGPVVVALVGPALGAVFWGRQYVAGLIGGYAVPFVVVPAATSWLGYRTYWIAEQAVRLIHGALPHVEPGELPPPVRYDER